MICPTSNKTKKWGKKPYIKKGYYPAQLIAIKPYNNPDGTIKECSYGHMIILDFAVYSKDEKDTPIKPLKYKPTEDSEEIPLVLASFQYYEYRNKAGELYTAFIKDRKTTKIFEKMGWNFSKEDIDLNKFIGTWVELNIDDYECKIEDEEYIASSINGINKYQGEVINTDTIELVKPREVIEKTIKHTETQTKEELVAGIEKLRKHNKDGFVTKEGLETAEAEFKIAMEKFK